MESAVPDDFHIKGSDFILHGYLAAFEFFLFFNVTFILIVCYKRRLE